MRNHLSFVPGFLLLISAAVPALADDKPPAADKGSDTKLGKHREGMPGHDGMKGHEEMKGREREHMPGHPGVPDHAGMPDAGAMPGMHGEDGGGDAGAARRHGYDNALRELYQELKDGKVKKEDLKAKLAQLQDTREQRRKEHQEDVGKRWGAALAQPPAREELKVHARRLALLNRALVLAQADTKPDKDKTIERISQLIDKENARHDKAMSRFQSQPASGTAAPSASAPATSASAASGGSQ